MSFIFTLYGTAIAVFSIKVYKNPVNLITVLFGPYLVIVPVNNYIMTGFGFYRIGGHVLFILLSAMTAFFTGWLLESAFFHTRRTIVQSENNLRKTLKAFDRKRIFLYCLFIDLLCICRVLLIIFRYGIGFLGQEEFSGVIVSGVLGHMLLSTFPLLPVAFLIWTKTRDFKMLVTYFAGFFLFFLSFVKYHIIGLIVCTFLFLVLEERETFKKGVFILAAAACGIFTANYAVSFFIRGFLGSVNGSFYVNHLWNYIAGSIINNNTILTEHLNENVSIFYKLGSFVISPVNLFCHKITGRVYFPFCGLRFMETGTNGEVSNVADVFGYLFPSSFRIPEIICYIAVLTVIGFVFSGIFNHMAGRTERGCMKITLSVFLTFFLFFSFFGTFFINVIPYELVFWSMMMPGLFNGKATVKIGSVYLFRGNKRQSMAVN